MSNKIEARPFYYLASPYTHEDPEVSALRFRAVAAAAGFLIRSGLSVYCPIAMTHPIEVEYHERLDFETWMALDKSFMALADGLIQLGLPGWEKSAGMAKELSWALKMGLPRLILHPEDCVPTELLDQLKVRA